MFDCIRSKIVLGSFLLPICLPANRLDIYYNLDIYFHPRTNQSDGFIEGVNHVRIVNNTQKDLKELYFHNAGNHYSKQESLTKISTVRCSRSARVSGQDSLVMKLGLFPPVNPGETVIIDIPFKTYFSASNPQLPAHGARKDTTTYNAINFYPVLEYYYANGWHSESYHNSIKPYTNFAKYNIIIIIF